MRRLVEASKKAKMLHYFELAGVAAQALGLGGFAVHRAAKHATAS